MNDIFDVNMSNAFYIPSAEFASAEDFAEAVSKKYPTAVLFDVNAEQTDHCMRDMKIVHRFLNGGAQTYSVVRYFMPDIRPDLEKSGFSDWCAMMAFFPESGVLSISFHYTIKSIHLDRLIVKRQSGAVTNYPFPEGERTFTDIAHAICENLGVVYAQQEESVLVEITNFGGVGELDVIERDHSNLIYGLLSGDEGWQYVPDTVVNDRLKCSWGSRNFMRIYCFGHAFVFINLLGSPAHEAYVAHQKRFGTAAWGSCNEYFLLESNPLSVNHGMLFSIEFSMILKTLINDVISYQGEFASRQSGSFYKRIKATREFRHRIIIVLEKAENIAISEMGELSAVMLESLHIAPIVDRVKYLLELIEGDLDLMYQSQNNTLVTILTVLGLVLAGIQIILPLLGV